jgi:hypothetical protein
MRCILIEKGIIKAVSNTTTAPQAPWRLVSDSFPGKVGDAVSSFGDNLEVDFSTVPVSVAKKLAEDAAIVAEKAEARALKAHEAYDHANKVAIDCVDRSTKAIENRNVAQKDMDQADESYREAELAYQKRKQELDAAIIREVNSKAQAAAALAYEEAYAKAQAEAGLGEAPGAQGEGSGDAKKAEGGGKDPS